MVEYLIAVGALNAFSSHCTSLVRTEHQEGVFDLTDRVNALCGSLTPSDDIGSTLCDPVSREEVCAALTRINKTSASYPDGILTGFHSTFLEVLGGALTTLAGMVNVEGLKPGSFSLDRILLLLNPSIE